MVDTDTECTWEERREIMKRALLHEMIKSSSLETYAGLSIGAPFIKQVL
jgi:hypothetical protein